MIFHGNIKENVVSTAVKDVTNPPRNLNKKFWNEKHDINSDVRKTLLNIAKDFWGTMEHGDSELKDITFTGSLTGERWSKNSDIDLHLVVKIGKKSDKELMKSYFQSRSKIWNFEHDITVFNFPIEIYIQDAAQPHHSKGVYSLISDEWITKKEPGDYANFVDVSKKAKVFAKDISNIIKSIKKSPTQTNLDSADKLLDRLRNLRSSGLDREGEGSVENLTYKALRRAGLLDKLRAASTDGFDQLNSL